MVISPNLKSFCNFSLNIYSMKNIFTLLLSFISLQACLGQTSTGNFTYDGVLRDYILHIPPGYNSSTPAPLVLNLHGYTSNAQQQQLYTGFDADADTAGYIVVYPNGIANAWNSGFNVPYHSGVDDLGFLSALIDTISVAYTIDPCRVFSTGMSNGGFMSYRLACELEDKIAAVASVTGSMTDSMVYYCQHNRPVAVMEMHGTADNTVPYNGTTVFTATEDNLAYWQAHNNCSGSAVTENLPDINQADGATVTKIYFSSCDSATELITYKINGGGHTWPGASLTIGVTTQDMRANSEILSFFNRHPKCNPTTTIDENENEGEQILIFPNPAENILHIKNHFTGKTALLIYDLTGKIIYSDENYTNSSPILLDKVSTGIYYVRLQNAYKNEIVRFVKK